jgi:hypothetical protein
VVGTLLGVLATPAHAAVDDCFAEFYTSTNTAHAICSSGFGYYRVAAKCDAATYPYSITIYGPWKYRTSSTRFAEWSKVDGDKYNCHIVKAWTDTR